LFFLVVSIDRFYYRLWILTIPHKNSIALMMMMMIRT